MILLDWLRFLASWAGISGIVSASTVCPCCGQPVCPFYAGMAALLGFLGAGFHWVLRKTGRRKLEDASRAHACGCTAGESGSLPGTVSGTENG